MFDVCYFFIYLLPLQFYLMWTDKQMIPMTLPHSSTPVPGGSSPEGPGWETWARAGRPAESHGGEQQLQQDGGGETHHEDGADQGESWRLHCSHAGATAWEGTYTKNFNSLGSTRFFCILFLKYFYVFESLSCCIYKKKKRQNSIKLSNIVIY